MSKSTGCALVLVLMAAGGCGALRADVVAESANSAEVGSDIAVAAAGAEESTHSTDEMALPIESYMPTVDEGRVIGAALSQLVDRCMAGYGFNYTSPPSSHDARLLSFRRYAYVYDQATAENWGYHVPMEHDDESAALADVASISDAEYQLLVGVEPGTATVLGLTGLAIPEEGCIGEARSQLATGSDQWGLPEVVGRINTESWLTSGEDPRVIDAFQSWSDCMWERGHKVTDPLFDEMPEGISLDTLRPTAAEIAMALDDVACQETTQVVRVWFEVESEIQAALIAQNADELAEIAREDEALLARATAIAQND